MKIAIYLRVSREDLNLDNQRIQLEEYAKLKGWAYDFFEETESTRKARPIKESLLELLRKGKYDGVLVYKLDRWARSLQELIMNIEELKNRGKHFIVLTQPIDTSNASGMLMLQILGAFAEFERELIRERTMAGLDRATASGKIKGRHPKNCGCGKRMENGELHNGFIKPKRNQHNRIIGWINEKTGTFSHKFRTLEIQNKPLLNTLDFLLI